MAEKEEKFRQVTVERDDGFTFTFDRDAQREDRFWNAGEAHSYPVRGAPDAIKEDALATRERVRKAGLL